MKKIFAATAAIALLSGGVLVPTLAHAQAGVTCATNNSSQKGPAEGTGNGSQDAPAASTCETLVLPSGRTTIQNGPGATDSGANTAPHEGDAGAGPSR
jgi:hypothetical protein